MSEIRFWKGVISILAVAFCLVLLFYTWSVLLPFLFGAVIAYLMDPLVDRFSSLGLRRDRVVIFLYTFMLILGVVVGGWLFPVLYREVNDVLANMSTYAKELNTLIDTVNMEIQRVLGRFIGERAEAFIIPVQAEKIVTSLFHGITKNILDVAHLGMWIFIIPFASFFALKESRRWINNLFDWTPSQYVESLLGLLAEVNATLGGYVRGVLLESMCVGVLTLGGLLALGVNGAVILAVVTALLNFVPFLALVIGGGLAMLAGYYQGLGVSIVFGIGIIYVAVRLIDDFFIIPFVMGHHVQLHPVVILFAILAGVELGGFVGLFFAIPLAAVIKTVLLIIVRDRNERLFSAKQHVYS